MSKIRQFVVAIITFLSGLSLCILSRQRKRIQTQKGEIEELEGLEQVRKVQMETLKEVQDEIRETIGKTPEPKRVEPPASGDSDSRLDRLNRLHKL